MPDKKSEKTLSKCEECRYKMEMAHAANVNIFKLMDKKDNVLFTRTTTTTEEYRSDLGAALVAALTCGQFPAEVVGPAIEMFGNIMAAKVAAAVAEAEVVTKKR